MTTKREFLSVLAATTLFAALAIPGLMPERLTGAGLEMVGAGKEKCSGTAKTGACPDDPANSDPCETKRDRCNGTSNDKTCRETSSETACIASECLTAKEDLCE